jgi:hypothetical protein
MDKLGYLHGLEVSFSTHLLMIRRKVTLHRNILNQSIKVNIASHQIYLQMYLLILGNEKVLVLM